jgi:hypothetical protein
METIGPEWFPGLVLPTFSDLGKVSGQLFRSQRTKLSAHGKQSSFCSAFNIKQMNNNHLAKHMPKWWKRVRFGRKSSQRIILARYTSFGAAIRHFYTHNGSPLNTHLERPFPGSFCNDAMADAPSMRLKSRVCRRADGSPVVDGRQGGFTLIRRLTPDL